MERSRDRVRDREEREVVLVLAEDVSYRKVPNLSDPLNAVELVFVLTSPGSNAEEVQTETEKGFRNERRSLRESVLPRRRPLTPPWDGSVLVYTGFLLKLGGHFGSYSVLW